MDAFLVIEVKGTHVNSDNDLMFKEKGYVVLLRSKENMGQCFDWCDDTIACPYYRKLLEKCCNMPSDQETGFYEESRAHFFLTEVLRKLCSY